MIQSRQSLVDHSHCGVSSWDTKGLRTLDGHEVVDEGLDETVEDVEVNDCGVECGSGRDGPTSDDFLDLVIFCLADFNRDFMVGFSSSAFCVPRAWLPSPSEVANDIAGLSSVLALENKFCAFLIWFFILVV